MQIEKKPVSLWNQSGEDYTVILKVQEFEFRLDMETAFHFAQQLSILGCGVDPIGYLYTSEELDQYDSVSIDLIRTNPMIQDGIYIEKQLYGACVIFTRFNLLTNQIQKIYVNLNEEECDNTFLEILELQGDYCL